MGYYDIQLSVRLWTYFTTSSSPALNNIWYHILNKQVLPNLLFLQNNYKQPY